MPIDAKNDTRMQIIIIIYKVTKLLEFNRMVDCALQGILLSDGSISVFLRSDVLILYTY